MKHTKIGMAALGVVTTFAMAACGTDAAGDDSKSLTVVSYGGEPQKAQVGAWAQKWADDNGVKLLQDSPTDYAKLRAQVEAKKVTWGAVEVEPNFAVSACEDGILEKIDLSDIDMTGLDPEQFSDCGVPTLQYSFTIAYNKESFKDGHPTTWAEFFDTDAFPGKRGLMKFASTGVMEAALLADGVAPDDLYPLDIDRALKKLDTIKDDIVWYETGDQQSELLSTGEASAAMGWSGRIAQGEKAGQPIANEWSQNLATYDQWVIPKGYAQAATAKEWLAHLLTDAEGQAKAAESYYYAPASAKALDKLPADIRGQMANAPENVEKRAILMDYDYWAENFDAVSEKFNAWLAG